MNDYSDLLFLIGAMVIFAILTVNANSMLFKTNENMVQSDIEYNAIALAQDEIEEIRWLENNEESKLKSTSSDYRYADPITKTLEINDETIEFVLNGTAVSDPISGLYVNTYQVTVTVTSPFMKEGRKVSLTTMKSFY